MTDEGAGIDVVFLGSKYSLPGSSYRREDAYEHDREMRYFTEAFSGMGINLSDADWRSDITAHHDVDAFLVRSVWDYIESPTRFKEQIKYLAAKAPLQNTPALIEWNMSKRYLLELDAAGLPVVPSLFIDGETATVEALRDYFGVSELVLKPIYGGGGYGLSRIGPLESGAKCISGPFFVQPFVPSIGDEGELSFIFVEKEFSHCVRKVPSKGGYLVHAYHGGDEWAYSPSSGEVAVARSFLEYLPEVPLVSRIDFVNDVKGLALMELELIDPHLYPGFASELGPLLGSAILRLVAS